MADHQVDENPTDDSALAHRRQSSKVVVISSVITAVATSIIALLLLYGAFVIGRAANELKQFGTELEETFQPFSEESFSDEFDGQDGVGDKGDLSQEYPEEEGMTSEELQAELDELEESVGPGPNPSAIRRTGDIETDVSDQDLRRYGLGVCFGAVFTPYQLVAELGLTEGEAERMMATAEGWCSA